MTERIESRLAEFGTAIENLWGQRRKDRDAAVLDNDRRHSELMGAIKQVDADVRKVNGTVRVHGEAIAGITATCTANHPVPGGDGRMPMTPATKLALMTSGGTVGAAGIVWGIVEIVKAIIEAVKLGGA